MTSRIIGLIFVAVLTTLAGCNETTHVGTNEADSDPCSIVSDKPDITFTIRATESDINWRAKPDDAPIEREDVELLLEAIYLMRTKGWGATMLDPDEDGKPRTLGVYDRLPNQSELLVMVLRPRMFDLGEAEHIWWKSTLVLDSADACEEVIEALPARIRPNGYLYVTGLYHGGGELRTQFAVILGRTTPAGVEFKAASVLLSVAISAIGGEPSIRFRAWSVR
jgi:hypothetical protein